MNIIFKIMAFSMMLNISIGLVGTALPIFGEDGSNKMVISMNGTQLDTIRSVEGSLSPDGGELQDKSDRSSQILDFLGLGFIYKFISAITDYTHGFIKMLDNIFGTYMIVNGNPTALYTFLFSKPFGALYSLMSIGYIYGAIYLFTNKDVMQ